jgi:CBS domain-containing protein
MTFDTPGDVLLRVSLEGGEVSIETGLDRRVEVELVPLRDNDATRLAIAEARVEMVARGGGQEVVVELRRRSGFTIGRGTKVGVQIRCPEGSDLVLRASSADLNGKGRLGTVEVKTASGDVSLDEVGKLHVDTASGDVRTRDVEGSTEIRTASGDVLLGRSGGPLAANLVSGDLLVDDAAAGLEVTTVSGDVQVRAAGGGGLRVQSVSGDVELALKPGQRLYVDASSVSGTMSSELGLDDTPPEGPSAQVHEVRVRTISGDLRIERAAVGSLG